MAQPCIIAVPSILIVAPKGIEKDAIDLFTPNFFVTVLRVKGIDALLLAVLKVKTSKDFNFLKNIFKFFYNFFVNFPFKRNDAFNE